jgi:3'(2'), 5'-bisphosphate nucleotidase
MRPLLDMLARVRAIAEGAGWATLVHYGSLRSTRKADGSPVTDADQDAEDIILPRLRALTPDIAVVSEEEASRGVTQEVTGGRFWLVDPLDGTREFLSGNGEFTVNIGLIEGGVPVLGVVVIPVRQETYAAAGLGTARLVDAHGEWVIAARAPPAAGLLVVGSRSHGKAAAMNAFLAARRIADYRAAGSSLKFCLIARGEADLYPRFGTTMEWDTAAGHAVLAVAGCLVTTLDGQPLTYGIPGYRNPHFFARGLG